MTCNWPEISLADIYDIRSGLSKPASAFGSGFPFLSFKEVFGNYFVPEELSQLVESSEKERANGSIKRGDVFLTRTSETMHELGMSSVALKDYKNATFNGFTKRLRPKEGTPHEVHPEFVGYYFRSPRFRTNMLAFSTLSTRASLNNDMITRLTLPLPPIDIQKKIAKILKCLDDKVSVNSKMNQTLEEMAQAIFKSWFVDFDPVKAKMNGQLPEGMDEATASLFPEKLVESELGLVPVGWDVEPLDSIFSVNKGLSYKGKFLSQDKSDVPLINLGNFGGNGKFRYEKVKYYSGDYKPRHVVKAGQLVIANTDMTQDRVILGSAILVPELGGEEYLTTHHTFSTSFKKQYPEDVWKYFVFYSLQRPSFRFRAEGFATGTTVLAMPKDAFTFCTVALPPVALVEKFSALVQSLKQKIACNEKENVELTNLRDILLPKLLSGEIELGQAQELAEVE
ncbi:restriction endonuclease subunit S [Vibrio sp. SCSIO 43086]|uniref:restriction endonuclease subunit S n=1 Tax=Vibrio sp. SCSIO 43086 TaxID=2822845 RepID=UPI003DA7F549